MDERRAQDEREPARTAKPCGPGPPMLGSSPRVRSRVTGANKPVPRGERGVSRKPLRREGRCFGVPVVILCAFFRSTVHTRLWVRADAPGLPCALYLGGRKLARLGQIMPREREVVSTAVFFRKKAGQPVFRRRFPAVIPGRSAGPNPESRDSGFTLRVPRNDGGKRLRNTRSFGQAGQRQPFKWPQTMPQNVSPPAQNALWCPAGHGSGKLGSLI